MRHPGKGPPESPSSRDRPRKKANDRFGSFWPIAHPVVREGLRALLEPEANLVIAAETGDGLETVRLVERLQPDVLVLALLLPGLSGLDVLPIVRHRSPRTRIIIFSDFDSESAILQSLRNGASAYVLKGADLDQVLEAVRRVANGHRFLSPSLEERAFDAYWEKAATSPGDPHDLLTPRERQALQLAAEGNNCTEIGARLSISPPHRPRCTGPMPCASSDCAIRPT